MSNSRRSFFQRSAIFSAGLYGLSGSLRAKAAEIAGDESDLTMRHSSTRGSKEASSIHVPMLSPDLTDVPFEMDGGVKVFKLVAAPVKKKIAPWKTIDAWGYNGSCPGPTIQVHQGDRVRVIFENRLPE